MAEKSRYRFKGHESFVLREGWLNKGLFAVNRNPRVFFENFGADALGVGPNMAKAIRYWMRSAGLTKESAKDGVKLTEKGALILQYDPYIEDMFTLWLVHCGIASNRTQATAWSLFFNDFPYDEFDRDRLFSEMKQMAAELCGGKAAQSSVESDCDAILHMYAPDMQRESSPEEKNVSPFGKLGLLKRGNGGYERRQPDLNRLPEAVVWYLMAEQLDGRTSVYLDDLLEMRNGPGRLLGLKRPALLEILERLSQTGTITINRTAGLNMVYLSKEAVGSEIIRDYYTKEHTA